MKQNQYKAHFIVLAAVFLSVLAWSAFRPYDYFTWILEVFPALLGVTVLWWLYPRFRFSLMVYYLVVIHSIILMVGGHFTYARVPLFDIIKEWFDLTRNHYDRVGHFAQGFFPAMIVREVLLRRTPLQRGIWLSFLVVCVCLAISAFYEFFEWWTAILTGTAANDFLGSQGDVWDSQWDMFLAFVGSIVSLVALRKIHDRSMQRTGVSGKRRK